VKPGDVLEDAEKDVFCSAAAGHHWQTAVRFQGKRVLGGHPCPDQNQRHGAVRAVYGARIRRDLAALRKQGGAVVAAWLVAASGCTTSTRAPSAAAEPSAPKEAPSGTSGATEPRACPATFTTGTARDQVWREAFSVDVGGVGLVTTEAVNVEDVARELGLRGIEQVACDGSVAWWIGGVACDALSNLTERLAPRSGVRASFCIEPRGADPGSTAPGDSDARIGNDRIDWYEMSRRYEDPSLTDYLPSKEMLENVDATQLPSAIGHWKMAYSHMLARIVLRANAPGRQGKVPKDLVLRKYNTPEMSWFLTAQSVKSYDAQLAVAQRVFGEASRFSVSLPCELVAPIGDTGGTAVDCRGVFEIRSFVPVESTWEGCQAKDVASDRNAVAYGAPGTMEVTHMWTAEMHLAESGQVDQFRLIPAPEPTYVVNPGNAIACADEPHWDPEAQTVSSVSISPRERLEHVGPRVWCSSGSKHRFQMAVRWRDKTCWVPTFAVTKVAG